MYLYVQLMKSYKFLLAKLIKGLAASVFEDSLDRPQPKLAKQTALLLSSSSSKDSLDRVYVTVSQCYGPATLCMTTCNCCADEISRTTFDNLWWLSMILLLAWTTLIEAVLYLLKLHGYINTAVNLPPN